MPLEVVDIEVFVRAEPLDVVGIVVGLMVVDSLAVVVDTAVAQVGSLAVVELLEAAVERSVVDSVVQRKVVTLEPGIVAQLVELVVDVVESDMIVQQVAQQLAEFVVVVESVELLVKSDIVVRVVDSLEAYVVEQVDSIEVAVEQHEAVVDVGIVAQLAGGEVVDVVEPGTAV